MFSLFSTEAESCDLSGPSLHHFIVKEQHQISCTSSNLPLPFLMSTLFMGGSRIFTASINHF